MTRSSRLILIGIVLCSVTFQRSLPRAFAEEPPAGLAAKLAPLLKPLPIDGADKNELTRLLTERHNAAVSYLSERLKQYQRGLRDLSAVFEGARLVEQAKLALAETPDSTVAVLEEYLGMAREIEAYTKNLLEKKAGSQADFDLARYNRLGIEIELLKAKQKTK
jgi:hypothetical protein